MMVKSNTGTQGQGMQEQEKFRKQILHYCASHDWWVSFRMMIPIKPVTDTVRVDSLDNL